ncbi:hypothetical protein OG500_23350 [Kitasatospora sp. NBC_01250]|uniref:DUF6542 domain-containing protein n=1 Tax=unclassified Kitasatospora TaxID=2633591 RepID=UPI002E0EC371|nr:MULTISPECIES: DUF6542 domain-containing protein [unclassified Kitasatospora]WSJ69011.1 hypothetical protein OG294_24455 [Kitasatospora sp. NBC_01302]
MEQSIRTQPPGPRPRPPAGGRSREAAVPGPAAPRDAVTVRPSRLRPTSGGPAPLIRLRQRLGRGGSGAEAARRPGPPTRLTAIGTGLLSVLGTLAFGLLDQLFFGGLGVLFGLGFLVVCFQSAVRVRLADLPAAPISGPIAFALAIGLLGPAPLPGVIGQLLALAGGLAQRAGWLFAGTGLATVIVAARFVAQRRIRRSR